MNKFIELAKRLDEVFEQEAIHLCDLDRQAGDGDHGLTISRGFHNAYEQVKLLSNDESASTICKTIGYGMLDAMGGASGPIFSTFFIQAAIILKDEKTLSTQLLYQTITETIESIHDLAGTNRNEKTMIDALYGAKEALNEATDTSIETALRFVYKGAITGANATIEMIATKGRAKFLQERSKGFMDAGSWSVTLIFKTLLEVFGGDAS